MNLLIKYYDYESIGGGIPDEVKQKIEDIIPDDCVGDRGTYPSYVILQKRISAEDGYSLASEKLKEKDEEIFRLKEENERLREQIIYLQECYNSMK